MDRNDGRALVGQMLAYDKHMNFVLAECEEFRTVKVRSGAVAGVQNGGLRTGEKDKRGKPNRRSSICSTETNPRSGHFEGRINSQRYG